MKCIIVDDEPLAREGMELNVRDVPFLELVGQFSTAIAANDFIMNILEQQELHKLLLT